MEEEGYDDQPAQQATSHCVGDTGRIVLMCNTNSSDQGDHVRHLLALGRSLLHTLVLSALHKLL